MSSGVRGKRKNRSGNGANAQGERAAGDGAHDQFPAGAESGGYALRKRRPLLGSIQSQAAADVSYVEEDYEHKEMKDIQVKIPDNFEGKKLLNNLRMRFEKRLKFWKKKAANFKTYNFVVTLVVIFIQLQQVFVHQYLDNGNKFREASSLISPAITGALIAIQLKLGWPSKAQKAKKNCNLYDDLAKKMEYRETMLDCNGQIENTDIVKEWNSALQKEVEVPALLHCC